MDKPIPEAVAVTLHQDRAGCEWIIVTSEDHPDSESEVTPSDDPALFDLLKALTAAQQQGQAVAWHVDAGTEHWVTDDVNEAAGNLAGGCVVRPLSFAGGPLSRGELHTDDTNADHERVRAERRAYLAEIAARNADAAPQPMQQGGGEVVAWLAADGSGRVIDHKAKAAGGRALATGSATSIYSIPLYTAPPSAPVVDEATARRLDDYLGGEFDIRIGKQAAHAALVHALATQHQEPTT